MNDDKFLEIFLTGMNDGFKYIDHEILTKPVYIVLDESEFNNSSHEKLHTNFKAEIIIPQRMMDQIDDSNLMAKSVAQAMGQRCMVDLVDLIINGNPESDPISGLNHTNKNEAYLFINKIDFGSEQEISGDLVLVAYLDIDYYFV